MAEINGYNNGNYFLTDGTPDNKCAKCSRTDCPNYVKRRVLNRFERVAISFTIGVLCVAVIFGCGVFAVKTASSLFSALFSSGTNEFSSFYDDMPEYDFPEIEDAVPQLRYGLGVTVAEISDYDSFSSGIDGGLVIVYFNEHNAFEGTDVQENDVIIGCEGEKIIVLDDLRSFLADRSEGDELTITIARFADGQPTTFEVTASLVPLETETEEDEENESPATEH